MSGTNIPPPAQSRTIVLPVPNPPLDLVLEWEPRSPGSNQDYSLDVTTWAAEQGETVTGFQALVSLPGSSTSPMTATQQPLVAGSNVCTVTLAGGVSATKCAVTFVITTATRQLTLTCWIVVVSLSGTPNRFGGLAYIGSALDPATASQIAALNFMLAAETQARIAADEALQVQIGQAAATANEALAEAASTAASYTALATQLHDFEQEVEQQLLELSALGGGAGAVAGDGDISATPTVTNGVTRTVLGLVPTGITPGTYAGFEIDANGRVLSYSGSGGSSGTTSTVTDIGTFLTTEGGALLAIDGGAANTFLGIDAGSSSGTTSGLSSLILTETGAGDLLAEDGVTPLSMGAN